MNKRGVAALGAALVLVCSPSWSQTDALRSANDLINRGNPGAALELLRPLKDANAQSAEYHYLVGIAALDSGDVDTAIESLREAARIKPDLAQAHAELARAYMQFGNLFLAQLELEKAKSLNPPPAVVAAMDKYVDDYHRELLAERKRFSGYISAGVGYDSNVNQATAAQSITLPIFGGVQATLSPSQQKQSDSFTQFNAQVAGFYPLSERVELIGGASALEKINSSVSQFNTRDVSATGGVRYNVDDRNRVSVVGTVDSIALDNQRVLDSGGFTAEWRRVVHPLVEAGVFAQRSRLDYPGADFRNVNRTVYGINLTPAAVGQRLNTTAPMLILYTGTERTLESDVPQLGHRLWGLRLGDVHYFSTRLASFEGLSYENRKYGGADPVFLSTRQDMQWDLTLGLIYKLDKDLSLVPVFTYTANRSNQEVFKYDRESVTMSLRYTF
ncbi:MAG TPA: tetratricopeptide repeat protein [Burkholderiales bacterium]|nr:tetratricopeptide repeat protein [Burkholderiales bacterium]